MTMAITDSQVATLRAHLAGNFDEYQRLWADLARPGAKGGYPTLIAAAFFEAADRRFTKGGGTDTDVIAFVGSARSRFDEKGDEIDPHAAEVLIRAVLGDVTETDLDDDTVITTQLTLLTALVLDEQFSGEQLDKFMAEARKLADEWTD
ncbi:hypothetical protein NE236_30975 [Actinoallomurus purpureus]|uniref:hypothetical protein n=1 Tax=Actinoallomurus purpureus TaxID=478114 RepID=UPI0020923D21|nr:hypothetical protein [Actinoallomurus purpureus]MCO6009403.1 hypothetical protein [Actinoallomurus purpureus]